MKRYWPVVVCAAILLVAAGNDYVTRQEFKDHERRLRVCEGEIKVLKSQLARLSKKPSRAKPTAKAKPKTKSTGRWFEGGNLHDATVAEWKRATGPNKLATAADWLGGTKWKGHLQSPRDFERLRTKARMLVQAVDEVAANKVIDHWQVNEVAALIATMANDLGP